MEELGAWLSEKRDTRVYTLNLCEMGKSMHFNPFLYIRSKSDVTKLVTNLIQNTNSPNIKNSSADPFWEKPAHPAVKAYQRYRGGPDETIRSVIMTVNARM